MSRPRIRRLVSSFWIGWLTLLIVLTARIAPAMAGPCTDEDWKRAVAWGETGKDVYERDRDYAKAYEHFSEAERRCPSPRWLGWMARCQRQRKKVVEARDLYERARDFSYLNKSFYEPLDEFEEARKRAQVERDELPIELGAEAPASPPPASPPPTYPQPVSSPLIPAEPPPPPLPPRRPNVPAFVLVGLAASGAVTSGIFAGLAASSFSRFNQHPTTANADKVDQYALIADISLGTTLTLGVTSAVLFLAGGTSTPTTMMTPYPKQRRSAVRGFVAPQVSPHGGGAAALLTF